jgi:transposase-like protein
MAKKSSKRTRRYPVGFQRDAVERMEHCADIHALAKELDVSRGALYLWRRKAEGLPSYRDASQRPGRSPAEEERARIIRQLEAKVASLEGELGRRSVEASFFKSALRKVEALRRQNEKSGAMPSTRKSAAGRSRKAK